MFKNKYIFEMKLCTRKVTEGLFHVRARRLVSVSKPADIPSIQFLRLVLTLSASVLIHNLDATFVCVTIQRLSLIPRL